MVRSCLLPLQSKPPPCRASLILVEQASSLACRASFLKRGGQVWALALSGAHAKDGLYLLWACGRGPVDMGLLGSPSLISYFILFKYHCEDYQILIPMAIHGLKSELQWPRYHENWDNASIDAPLTSESHNFWSNRWIFKIHTFSKTGSQNLSRGVKINPIHGLLKVAALEGLVVALQGQLPRKVCQGYKRP